MQSLKAIQVPEVGEILNVTKSREFFSLLFLNWRHIDARNTIPTGDFLADAGNLLELKSA